MLWRLRLDDEKEMMKKSDDQEEFVAIEPILRLEANEKVKKKKND